MKMRRINIILWLRREIFNRFWRNALTAGLCATYDLTTDPRKTICPSRPIEPAECKALLANPHWTADDLDDTLCQLVGMFDKMQHWHPIFCDGYVAVVRAVLDRGANPNAVTAAHRTPGRLSMMSILMMAMNVRHQRLVQLVRTLIEFDGCFLPKDEYCLALVAKNMGLALQLRPDELRAALRNLPSLDPVDNLWLYTSGCVNLRPEDVHFWLAMGANPLARDAEGRDARDVMQAQLRYLEQPLPLHPGGTEDQRARLRECLRKVEAAVKRATYEASIPFREMLSRGMRRDKLLLHALPQQLLRDHVLELVNRNTEDQHDKMN